MRSLLWLGPSWILAACGGTEELTLNPVVAAMAGATSATAPIAVGGGGNVSGKQGPPSGGRLNGSGAEAADENGGAGDRNRAGEAGCDETDCGARSPECAGGASCRSDGDTP
jgi:hypothetical protein